MYNKLIDMGRIKPEDQMPDIEPFYYYIESFFELHTCRNNEGPIPFTAIHNFAKIYNEYDFDEFLYIIRLLDDVFLEQKLKKSKERSKDDNANKNH